MLESFLLQLILPLLINPADPSGEDTYRSGVDGSEKHYSTDKPKTAYPMITFDTVAYDSGFNYVKPGIYAVDLSPDAKSLLILTGRKVIARCRVIQVIELDDDQKAAVPSVGIALVKGNKVFIIYKNENLEVHGFLYKSDELTEY